jgi:hypothetical protein
LYLVLQPSGQQQPPPPAAGATPGVAFPQGQPPVQGASGMNTKMKVIELLFFFFLFRITWTTLSWCSIMY